MLKVRKVVLVFIVVLIQSALAISAGIAVIYLTAGNTLPSGIVAGNADIGGLNRSDAAKKIDEYYGSFFREKNLEIVVDEKSKYNIAYADIDVSVDSSATLDYINNKWSVHYLPNLMKAYFGRNKVVIAPVIMLNEGKLRGKLIELSQKIVKEPVNASIYIENEAIVKKAETNGFTLNVGNAVELIKKQMFENPGIPVKFNSSGNYEIETVPAKIKLKEINDIDSIIAEYSTDIIDPELVDSIRFSVDAVNGIILPPEKNNKDDSAVFSFVDWLKSKDAAFENDNEGFDQVASTLYAALLTAGIEKDAITRLPHKLAVEYIDAGLDAWISGNAGDLKFANTLSYKLAVFIEIKDNRLTVRLAGSILDKKEKYTLKVDITQKFDPPVVNMENNNLKPGEKIMLSPGKEGMTVNLFRNQELISTDKYDAVRAIVQIGPGTDWNNEK